MPNKLFVTIAVQDIEAFSKRDYERPGTDANGLFENLPDLTYPHRHQT